MDSKNYERVTNFMDAWGYKLDDLRMYLRTVAPELKVDPQRKLQEGMNDFLSGLCGRKEAAEGKPRVKGKFIPQPEGSKEGIAYDLWMRFSDEFSLEDLADYASERAANMARAKESRAADDSMGMSKLLYALEGEKRGFAEEMFERHKRITNEKCDINEFLRNARGDISGRATLVAPAESQSDAGDFFRGVAGYNDKW